MAKSKSKAKKVNKAAVAEKLTVNEEKKAQPGRKQIRDAIKKKARTKKKVITILVATLASILAVALISVGMFFAVYDPLGDNIEAAAEAIFTMPYDKPGSDDIVGKTSIFPLDQSTYFYFLNNYPDIFTADCCMSLKDNIQYWNGWNTQKEGYTVKTEEFAYQKVSEGRGYFEVVLSFNDAEGTLVDSMILSGSFTYDAETNLITDIGFNYESITTLGEMYRVHVLGQEPETTEEETAE